MVRVSHFNGDEFGGCTDLPENCSTVMVINSYVMRGYQKIHMPFVDGKTRMMNLHGYLIVIENIHSLVRENVG